MDDTQFQSLKQLEEYISHYYPVLKNSHFTKFANNVYMTAARNKIELKELISNLYKGIIDIQAFENSKNGNIYNFKRPDLPEEYRSFLMGIKDITEGSNGGMANIGKCEWLISFCSGVNIQTDKPYVEIIKGGGGDLKYTLSNKNVELKWNGGKVSVKKSGMTVDKIFSKLITNRGIINNTNKWVPFRNKDKNDEQKNIKNGLYWQAISDENFQTLTDNQLKEKIINTSFKSLFETCDVFIMFNDDGRFQTFENIDDVNLYYQDKYDLLSGSKGFECRANQSNHVALYCYVF